MRTTIVVLFLSGILFSGCVTSPVEQVPIVKVDVTFAEENSIAVAKNFTFSQGTVEFVKRPRNSMAESFPAIAARTVIVRSNVTNVSWIGPWETLPYTGNGTYSFNVGFDEKHYPKYNDLVQISLMVVNKDGDRIGNAKQLFTWTQKSAKS